MKTLMTLKTHVATVAIVVLTAGCASPLVNSPIEIPAQPQSPALSIQPIPTQPQAAIQPEPVGITVGSIVPIEKPVFNIAPTWTMSVGHTIGQELQAWGVKAGWKVIWNLPRDWSVPAPSQFSGDFSTAASEVIETLAENGALIHAQFFSGNKTLVVSGPGVSAQ